MKPVILAAFILLPFVVGGCSMVERMTTAKASFVVAVKNESSQPIRIGITKDGPPQEEEWASPEEFAIFNVRHPDAVWGEAVLPGQTATLPETEGRFNDGVHAILRVYAGDVAMADMLSIGRHSASRLDLPLAEGSNRFVIGDDQGRLMFKRVPVKPATAAAVAKK